VRERAHQALAGGELLQMAARLTQLDPAAFDVADAKAPADERVQAHAAGRQLAPRLARRELDPGVGGEPLQLLALDQREVLRRLRASSK